MGISNNRRAFLRAAAALAGTASGRGAAIRRPPVSDAARQQAAYQIRQSAALFQSEQPAAAHRTNGDETSLPNYIASFTKGLPHTELGEVVPGTYQTLLYALSTGNQSDFENIDRGSGMKFANPMAAFAY